MNRYFFLAALIISLIFVSCSSSTKPLYDEYIDVDPCKEELTEAEQAAMFELGVRISDHLQFNEDGTISLTKTTEELNICEKAYTTTLEVISWYNGLVKGYRPATKSGADGEGEKTDTRGGNEFSDSIASLISSVFEDGQCPTAKKFFDMWYFNRKTDDYTMTDDEWNALLPIADAQAKDTYSTSSKLQIGDSTYHSVQVSFYDTEDYDLMLSYGRSTLYYSTSGKASGFYDVYDFNISQAQRSELMQIAVIVVNYLGGGDGFKIFYGVHP